MENSTPMRERAEPLSPQNALSKPALRRSLSYWAYQPAPLDLEKVATLLKNNIDQIDRRELLYLKKLQNKLQDHPPEETTVLIELLQRATQQVNCEKLIQPAPLANEKQLLSNLKLIIDKFPQYQLGNDLAVYDVRFNPLPAESDSHQIAQKLITLKQKFETNPEISSCLDMVLEHYKPQTIVQMQILLNIGEDTQNTVYHALLNSLDQKIATIVNKELFINNKKELIKHANRKYNFYAQEKGDLLLILPKNNNPADLGFQVANCTLLNETEMLQPDFNQSLGARSNYAQFSEDIDQLLLQESPERGFHRLTALFGHGKNDKIADLELKEFQKTMEYLKNKKLAFLLIQSCYAGGKNRMSIQTPSGLIPCAVVLKSALEKPSFHTGKEFISAFDDASRRLFYKTKGSPLMRKQLTKNDLKHITKKLEYNRLEVEKISKDFQDDPELLKIFLQQGRELPLANLPTALFPTTFFDIPKAFYHIPQEDAVCNLHYTLQKRGQAEGIVRDERDLHFSQSHLLLSDPIIPNKLIYTGDKTLGLFSTGGASRHLLCYLEAEMQSLEELLKYSFDVGGEADKAYFIATLKCRYQGQASILKNVLINSKHENKSVLFKLEGEKRYTCLNFVNLAPPDDSPYWVQDKHIYTLDAQMVQNEIEIASAIGHRIPLIRKMDIGKNSYKAVYEKASSYHKDVIWLGELNCHEGKYKDLLCIKNNLFIRKRGRIFPFTQSQPLSGKLEQDLRKLYEIAEQIEQNQAERDFCEELAKHFT